MRVLVVEDDKGTSRFLKKGLTETGYVVDTVFDGEEGIYLATTQTYDIVILDVMLPEANGFEVLKAIRKKDKAVPVVFLTARDEKDDVIHGLELGADDYLVKPFAFAELLARIKAVVRRGRKDSEVSKVVAGNLILNLIDRTVEKDGKIIELSGKEFQLLEYLMRNEGQILTRTMILENVWGYDFDTSSNIIDVHINRLRSKIEKGFPENYIHTIKGVGYVFKDKD